MIAESGDEILAMNRAELDVLQPGTRNFLAGCFESNAERSPIVGVQAKVDHGFRSTLGSASRQWLVRFPLVRSVLWRYARRVLEKQDSRGQRQHSLDIMIPLRSFIFLTGCLISPLAFGQESAAPS